MKMKIEVEKLSKYKYVHWNGIFILRLRFGCKIGRGTFGSNDAIAGNDEINLKNKTLEVLLKLNSTTLFLCYKHLDITSTAPNKQKIIIDIRKGIFLCL